MTEELTAEQVAELGQDLRQLEGDLEGLLAATETGAKPVELRDNKGRLSRMAEMHDQSILVANRNLTTNRLKQVVAAIGRISAGTYGYCAVCEEPISLNRLRAYPETTMCLECKAASEE